MSEPPSRSPGGSPAMISTDSSLVSPSISRSCPQLPLHDHAEHQRNSEWDYLATHLLGSIVGTILAIFGTIALAAYLANSRTGSLALLAMVLSVAGNCLILT